MGTSTVASITRATGHPQLPTPSTTRYGAGPALSAKGSTQRVQISEVFRIAAELGRESRQTVSSYELLEAKVDRSVVAALVRSGRWIRLWRGMYLCAPGPVTAVVGAHAAMKYASRRGPTDRHQPPPVLSGLAGAVAMGLRWVPDHSRVQVLVGPDVQRQSNESVLVRRTWDVEGVQTWSWAGLPVANPTRLVVDGARECGSLRDVRGLALGAIADGLTTPAQLTALLDVGAKPGSGRLRRAVLDAERGAASPPEAEVVDALVGRGWPFVVNAEIRVHGQLVGVFDIYLLGTGVGGEVDSVEWHSGASLQTTLDRHERSSLVGLSLVHVTPAVFRADPPAFLARLDGAVRERRVRGLTEPPGLEILPRGPVMR